MIHTKLKPSKKFDINFHPSELTRDIEIPEESKEIAKNYLGSETLAENEGYDLMIMLDDCVIYGYDYNYKNKKVFIPELSPITIFYSNAIMSFGQLEHYKNELLTKSAHADDIQQMVNFNHFGTFFQLGVNCIINLQASLESFLNQKIIGNHTFLNKKGKPRRPNIYDKIEKGIQAVTKLDYKNEQNLEAIKDLIQVRNNIIHLKPEQEITNTRYKTTFREVISFDFKIAVKAIKDYINFYEPNLIEECSCGKEFYYDVFERN
tara:strand:- start:427 stop:1215 length:789 start_codon:yes stop_codon:yes gene_type:complete